MQMHEQMHILSPLVPPREFYFLRHCQQIELGVWVIVDVSYDLSKENISPSRSWRLPSGCMIQDMLNGCSKVSNFSISLTWWGIQQNSTWSARTCQFNKKTKERKFRSALLLFYRLLGLNTWKWMIKPKLIGSSEILYAVVVLLMEHSDGLLLSRGCVSDLLTPWQKIHLVVKLLEVTRH